MQEPTQTPGAGGASPDGTTEAGLPTWSSEPTSVEAPESPADRPAAGAGLARTPSARRRLGAATLVGAAVVGSLAVGFAVGQGDGETARQAAQAATEQPDEPDQGRAADRPSSRAAEAAWTSPDGRTTVRLEGRDGAGMRGVTGRSITISGIDGTKLSLETANGWTRTIDAGGATVTKAGETVALSVVEVGDEITFRETRENDGTYTITAIAVVEPSVSGTVGSVSGSTVTVTTRDGDTRTVILTSATTYRSGRADATRDALVVGVRIRATGSLGSDGRLTATSVVVSPATATGTVKEKAASSITLSTSDGSTLTVKVTAATTYSVAGVDSATLADIAVGAVVVAAGTTNEDGSLTATKVGARPAGEDGRPGGSRGHGRGFGGLQGGGPGDDESPRSSPLPSGEGTSS